MPRDAIQRDAYKDQLIKEVDEIPAVFSSRKEGLQRIFNTLIAYRDDEDTPAEYVAVLQSKIDQGKSIVQGMLDGIT